MILHWPLICCGVGAFCSSRRKRQNPIAGLPHFPQAATRPVPEIRYSVTPSVVTRMSPSGKPRKLVPPVPDFPSFPLSVWNRATSGSALTQFGRLGPNNTLVATSSRG